MKKLISVAVALCVAITSLFTGIYAMADNNVTSKDIKEKLNDTATYLLSEKKADFGVTNAKDLVAYINAGVDVSDYKDEFVSSVNDNLTANDGKIVTIVKTDYDENWAPVKVYNEESAGVYANVIIALDYFGFDAKDYEGVNLVDNFKNVKLNKDYENPYLFSSVFTVASKYALADTLKTAQNFLLNNFYEFGTGSTYYTSTDSDAQLVIALAPYSDKFQSVIDDTFDSIESFKADGGYLYNLDNTYGEPAINGDSTALALAAYSSVNDLEKAQKVYSDLEKNFECKDTKGAYAYTADGDENALATADAFTGLTKFYDALKAKEDYEATTTTTTTTTTTAPATSTTATTTTSTTATTTTKATTKYAKDGSYVNAKAKKASIKKLTNGKKSVKATWKKVTGVTGYQIQISTSKKFSRETSTYSITKNSTTSKTFKSLKAKKTYYVRIRAYKNTKVNGKTVKVYSKWSAVKSVKTK